MACNFFGVPFAGVPVGNTAKTAIAGKAAANVALRLTGATVTVDGTDYTKGSLLIELCSWDGTTGSPGTSSTPVTPGKNDLGRPEAVQATFARNWSVEPTVLVPIRQFELNCVAGQETPIPITAPVTVAGGKGLAVRVTTRTASFTCNVSGSLQLEE